MLPLISEMFLTGVVESVDDPLRLGRVAVRYLKIHTDSLNRLPTSMLPWSNVMGTINSAAISGVGVAPVGMVPGTMVYALPLDDGYQEFLVIGTLAGNRSTYINSSFGFNDPSGNFPISGVNGDVNILAGGIGGNTGASSIRAGNTITSNPIPGSTDPTVPPAGPPVVDSSAPWMPIAISQLGINQKDNLSTVLQYEKIGGGISTGALVSWCSCFVNYCLIQAGINGTRSASSRSFMGYGTSTGMDNVPYGAIVVFGVPNSGSGHVAFCVKDSGSVITCVGGNQSDRTASRSGGIVSQSNFPKSGGHLVMLGSFMPNSNNKAS